MKIPSYYFDLLKNERYNDKIDIIKLQNIKYFP